MAKVFGFSRPIARTLLGLAKSNAPVGATNVEGQEIIRGVLRSYVVILEEDCPAATYDEGEEEWTVGEADAFIWKRINDNDEETSQDPANSVVSKILEEHKDEADTRVSRRVFNLFQRVVPKDVPTIALQDVFGDLYLLQSPGTIGWGFLNEGMSSRGTASVSVCDIDEDDNEYDTGLDIDIRDVLGNVGEDGLEENTYVQFLPNGRGLNLLTNANCAPEEEENLPQVEEEEEE